MSGMARKRQGHTTLREGAETDEGYVVRLLSYAS